MGETGTGVGGPPGADGRAADGGSLRPRRSWLAPAVAVAGLPQPPGAGPGHPCRAPHPRTSSATPCSRGEVSDVAARPPPVGRARRPGGHGRGAAGRGHDAPTGSPCPGTTAGWPTSWPRPTRSSPAGAGSTTRRLPPDAPAPGRRRPGRHAGGGRWAMRYERIDLGQRVRAPRGRAGPRAVDGLRPNRTGHGGRCSATTTRPGRG